MKTKTTAALSLLLCAVFAVPTAALASDCHMEIDAVRVALNDPSTTVEGFCFERLRDEHKNGDRACDSLNSKLDGADTKIDEGKYDDARKKIANFRSSLDGLFYRAKPLISEAEYYSVSDALVTAEACVAGLGL
jgi:hypothetical protein